MRVLVITSEYPTPEQPHYAPFIVREVEALRKAGIDLDVFPFRGGMQPGNYLRAWIELRRHLNDHRYDLLHAQFGQSGLLALFPKNHPLVVTFQGSDLNGIYDSSGKITAAGYLLRKASQLVALRADEIILVSGRLAAHLPRKRYHLIPGGVDFELFKPMPREEARKALRLKADRRYVLFVGEVANPIKRFELAQTAVEELRSGCTELLVASGVPPDRMPLYMNAADALLLTSNREGSPTVIKEALACDLPVVSVDVGDVRERLEKVPGCAVCADHHPAAVAAALRRVLKRGERVRGRESLRDLDIHTTARKIIQVYQHAISSGS